MIKSINQFQIEQTNIGLGLIISKEIVERYGGKISFNSEVDEGSSFKFEMELEFF